MTTFRCPRCALDVEGRDRFQVCRFCKFKGYFLPIAATGVAADEDEGEPAARRQSAVQVRPVGWKPTTKPTFVMHAQRREPTSTPRRSKRQSKGSKWLRDRLLRLMADGKGGRRGGGAGGDGPSLWQILPRSGIIAVLLAGTALGFLLALVPHGGIAALRADDGRFAALTALALVALGMGWSEWWRHRGERWGLFARFLGGLAAVLGGAYILVVLLDVIRSAL